MEAYSKELGVTFSRLSMRVVGLVKWRHCLVFRSRGFVESSRFDVSGDGLLPRRLAIGSMCGKTGLTGCRKRSTIGPPFICVSFKLI